MNVLVTGSTGLIGKTLVKELKKKGFTVKEFAQSKGQDITNKEDVKNAVFGADIVIHLAALLDETLGLEELRKVNVKGTENVLEECARQKIDRLIYLSSVGVYGSRNVIADEKTPFSPETNYEKSKAEAEELVNKYHELIPITILRPSLVYGPSNYWKEIVKIAKKGFPIIGNGKNRIQLIHFRDVVNAIIFCLEKDETIGETYNIAEKNSITYVELQKYLTEALGIKFREKHIPIWLAMLFGKINAFIAKLTGKKTLLIPEHIKRILKNRLYNVNKIEKLGWKTKYEFKKDIKEAIKN